MRTFPVLLSLILAVPNSLAEIPEGAPVPPGGHRIIHPPYTIVDNGILNDGIGVSCLCASNECGSESCQLVEDFYADGTKAGTGCWGKCSGGVVAPGDEDPLNPNDGPLFPGEACEQVTCTFTSIADPGW
jgi:hypothetical protein